MNPPQERTAFIFEGRPPTSSASTTWMVRNATQAAALLLMLGEAKMAQFKVTSIGHLRRRPPARRISLVGVSVLIVEDEPLIALDLHAALSAAGAGIMAATDTAEALRLIRRNDVNAAVLDMEPVNETAGFTQAGILGGNFLRNFRIYFDFARGSMRLESLNKPKTPENINPETVLSTP